MKFPVRHLMIGAALLGGAMATQASPALADEAADPFAGLNSVAQDGLSELNGRQGLDTTLITNLLQGTQTFEIDSNNNTVEAGTVNSGTVGLNNSFTNMNGVNAMAVNTGIGANVQNGLIVLINMY